MPAICIIAAAALAFFVLAAFLFCGKGKHLIAGYSTASKAARETMDERRLCRAAGFLCTVCGGMLCLLGYLGHRVDAGLMPEERMLPFGLLFAAVVVASLIAAGRYLHPKAKK